MTSTSSSAVTVDVRLRAEEWETELATECVSGLLATPKVLSPVWFYDTEGSQLFDEITRLPEYYPTRAERDLLEAHAVDIVSLTRPTTLVELGSGTSDKTRWLLDAMAATSDRIRYVPFDVSEQTVRDAAAELIRDYEGLQVDAVVGDFHRHLGAIPPGDRRLVCFLGGTIGNLDPSQRSAFLRDVRSITGPGDAVLIGLDLVKDVDTLVRAYDDASGLTAAFNRNALSNLNRRFGADFDPDAFEHLALWNSEEQWIEMHLVSRTDQTVTVDALGITVDFRSYERMRTEISAKFSPGQLSAELSDAGFDILETWTQEPGFRLVLAEPAAAR
jgi:L-histidine N-alpha-methyltransferase